MKKSLLIGAFCAFILIVLTNTAHAAVVNPILGLNIDGIRYDVTFHDGAGDSFNALWDADNDGVFGGGASVFSTAPTFWNDLIGARKARDAIIAALGSTDSTTGIVDRFLVPWFGSDQVRQTMIGPGTDIITSTADSHTDPATDIPTDSLAMLLDSDVGVDGPYASFAVSAVPISPAIALFGFGLLWLIVIARRKKAA